MVSRQHGAGNLRRTLREVVMSSPFRWAMLSTLTTGAILAATVPAGAAAKPNFSQASALLTRSLKLTNASKSLTISGHGASAGKTVNINVSAGGTDAFGVLTYSGQSTTIRRV